MLTFEEWRHTYADVFETDDAARAAWTAACNRGYRTGMQDTRALLAAHSAGAQALDPRDVLADTGRPEADRLIGRLTSADPDFDDCTDAAVLIRQLVIEHRGPDGYVTWKEAAVAERQKRVEAERNAGMQGMPPAYDEISALLLDYAKACQESSSATRVSEARSAIMLAFRRALYAHPQPMPQTDAARDAKRLDWLCEYVVNVRMPLVYGSKDMFWASPVDDDSGHAPSDLRARIDSEIERLDRAKGE